MMGFVILRFVVKLFLIGCLTEELLAAPTTYTAAQIETDPVRFPDFVRHEKSSKDGDDCIFAPKDQVFEQMSFQARKVKHEDDDESLCNTTFDDYSEYAPGIQEPRKACLHSYVKSVGGVLNNNKRGRIICEMDYSVREEKLQNFKKDIVTGHDTNTVIVGLPADIKLEREKRSLVTISVPLRTLQFSIDQSIRDKNQLNLPSGFDLHILNSEFKSYSNGALVLHYYVNVDISGPVGAKCEVNVKFAIPTTHPETLLIQDSGTTSDCSSGNTLGQWFNLSQKLSDSIRTAITQSLGKQLLDNNSTFADWAKEDPDLATIFQSSLIQGSYCDWRGQPGICLAIGWRQPDTIDAWETSLLSQVPKGFGPFDRDSAQKKLQEFEEEAISKHQFEEKGLKFPSGRFADGSVEDGDMLKFGGLLSRSASKQGIQLVRDSCTPDGRCWRSPRRIGEPDTRDHASFSGDQLKGFLHHLISTNDRNLLEKYLQYILTQKTSVPDSQVVLESGYSSCPNFAPNFTCLIGGSDWYALKLLARKHGIESKLPSDLASIEARYGFSYDALIWEALMTNAGYRLELVANTAWILRSLGEDDRRLDKVIQIIAARQSENPFFLYLLLGPDQRVQQITDSKCTLPIARTVFSDWAWQRSEKEHAWERSMVWDCVFMYGLLSRDPLPIGHQ